MKTILRTLSVWLLLLALPFQGLAVARMLPQTSATGMAMAVRAAPAAHPCHDMQPAAIGAAHAAPADAAPRADGKRLGACADCCIAVAPLPARIVPPAFPPPSIAIPFHAGHVPSVDPALPERPPRFLPA